MMIIPVKVKPMQVFYYTPSLVVLYERISILSTIELFIMTQFDKINSVAYALSRIQ
jgi:hypothetical protein